MFLSGSGTEFSEKNTVNRSCGPFISPYEGHHRHKNYQRRQSQVPGIPLRNKQIQQMNANDNSKDFCWRNPIEIWWRNLIWWKTIKFANCVERFDEVPKNSLWKERKCSSSIRRQNHAMPQLRWATPRPTPLLMVHWFEWNYCHLSLRETWCPKNRIRLWRNIRSINSLCFPTERDGKIKP